MKLILILLLLTAVLSFDTSEDEELLSELFEDDSKDSETVSNNESNDPEPEWEDELASQCGSGIEWDDVRCRHGACCGQWASLYSGVVKIKVGNSVCSGFKVKARTGPVDYRRRRRRRFWDLRRRSRRRRRWTSESEENQLNEEDSLKDDEPRGVDAEFEEAVMKYKRRRLAGRQALFMTAKHCVGSSMSIEFTYEHKHCTTGSRRRRWWHKTFSDGSKAKTTSCGVSVLAQANDWALLEVASGCHAADSAATLQLAASSGSVNDEIFLIGHPDGLPKIISHAEAHSSGKSKCHITSTGGSFMKYWCDTKGGMSGCAVFNRKTNKVIAVHTNGGCTTSHSSGNAGCKVETFKTKVQAFGVSFT